MIISSSSHMPQCRMLTYLVSKKLIWFNVVVQVLFPLSVAFSPFMLAKADEVTLNIENTHPYTIQKDESIESISSRYNLSVEQLKKINQFRTFRHSFEQLSAGDEIDVPDANAKNEGSHPKIRTYTTPKQNDELEKWLASNSSSLGGELSSRNHPGLSDIALTKVRTRAVSGTESVVSQWLNHFGTAQVQLGVTDDISMSESSLDMLVPLYDNGRFLLFSQVGARYQDDRKTVNLGAGGRFFTGKWMYGANGFYDNDITGDNRRIGTGVELWTDYLRFAGNAYYRLSDWHQSRDIVDYDERPANGFDASVSGWLPAYPQLGATLKYEQYFGDEVALINSEARQRNPRAVTAGVEYSPFPFMTMGSEYRKSGGKSDMQFNVQFKWTPGIPFGEQFSTDAVAAGKTLAGSRLELVERNNNIILEYKKQEVIKLSLPDNVRGVEGSIQPLKVSVKSKYGLDHIDWQLPSDFMASGGMMLTPVNGIYQLKLPLLNQDSTGIYEITGVAWDQKGNASKLVRMQVKVERTHIDVANSSLLLDSSSPLIADGKSTRKIILTARDSNNTPVTGIVSLIAFKETFTPMLHPAPQPSTKGSVVAMIGAFSQTVGEYIISSAQADMPPTQQFGGVKIGDFKETTPGVYEAIITSGSVAGEFLLNMSVNDVDLPPLTVNLTEETYILENPRLLSSQTLADGVTSPEVLISVKDKDGKPVVEKTISISVDSDIQEGKTDKNGDFTVILPVQTVPNSYSFNIHRGDAHILVTVKYISALKDFSNSVLSADSSQILANSIEKSTINLILKDSSGNMVPAQNIVFVATPSEGVLFSSVIDHGDGTYTAELRGSQSGRVSIGVQVDSIDVPTKPVEVTLVQILLQVFKNGALLQSNPVVGDVLNAVMRCNGGGICSPTTGYRWEVETSPGSDVWKEIIGAVTDKVVITSDLQKRRLRVVSDK